MTTENKKWNDEAVATLMSFAGSQPVSAENVRAAAEALKVSERSVAAKLRNMDIEVASLAKEKTATFTADQTAELVNFVNGNANLYTYKEIAEKFPGEFSAKQIQGKLLALELTDKVRPAEKIEVARTYTPEEEAVFVKMANGGSFIEDIAAALNKSLNSARGKALSLARSGDITAIPKQKESHAKVTVDPVEALGANLAKMTVAEIAKTLDRTERGIKTLLTRRGIKVADYDGATKREKASAKKVATA
ncbi:MAG TPA: hypothetical protein V6C58_05455 [Allocoleopsis sp.]